MADVVYQWIPAEGVNLLLVLFLSFLVGLEREEHKAQTQFAFGGVRTFPLIGLIGYSLALLSGDQILPVALGFAVVGAFMVLSYWHKVAAGGLAGVTTEMSALTTYLVGPLVFHNHVWLATALCVASVFLLQLKAGLENLTKQIAPDDILTFTKFLLLSAVILPIVPDRAFTQFQINPFRTWLVVVAVSGVSYGGYVVQRLMRAHSSVIVAALLGGSYSSTVTTVVLARRSATEDQPPLYAGAILMASGMMYVRLVVLVGLFNWNLMRALALPFALLAALAIGCGWLWTRRGHAVSMESRREFTPRNPLELRAAFGFALLFLAMLVATQLAVTHLGHAGVYSLAAIMGVSDVDPFIIGVTEKAGTLTPLPTAAAAIVIAAASNNIVKGAYAYGLSSPAGRLQSLLLLLALAALGFLPLLR
jgi:uncharacterized membrane protein (DUF4010 family)